jgi:serine/threonine protein kinase
MDRAKLRRKAMKSLMDEINILKNINSPYVIKVYDVLKSADHFFIITEFCNGGNLEDKLTSRGCYGEKDVSLIFG